MSPQEKAFRLYELIRYDVSTLKGTEALINEVSKQCALISLEFANEFADDSYRSCYGYKHTMDYLEQVKLEIEKL